MKKLICILLFPLVFALTAAASPFKPIIGNRITQATNDAQLTDAITFLGFSTGGASGVNATNNAVRLNFNALGQLIATNTSTHSVFILGTNMHPYYVDQLGNVTMNTTNSWTITYANGNSISFSNGIFSVGAKKVLDNSGNIYWPGGGVLASSLGYVYSQLGTQIIDPSGDVNATSFTGPGSAITSLNASQLTSGTVPAARLPALTGAVTTSAGSAATSLGSFTSANLSTALTDETGTGAAVFGTAPTISSPNISGATITSSSLGGTHTGDGSGLTSLSASQLTSGTMPAGRLPAFTGDATSSAGSSALTLKNTGTAGSYPVTTFDAQGRETSGRALLVSDLPSDTLTNNRVADTTFKGGVTVQRELYAQPGAAGQEAFRAWNGFPGNTADLAVFPNTNFTKVSGVNSNAMYYGDGGGLTNLLNLDAGNILFGVLDLSHIPSPVVTNTQTGVTLTSGTFNGTLSGDGIGITDISGANINQYSIDLLSFNQATQDKVNSGAGALPAISSIFQSGWITPTMLFTNDGVGISPVTSYMGQYALNVLISTNGALIFTNVNAGARYMVLNDPGHLGKWTIQTTPNDASQLNSVYRSDDGNPSSQWRTDVAIPVSISGRGHWLSPVVSFTNVNNVFVGNGSGLTSLAAGNISSGTLSAARLPAFTGDATSSAGASALTLATVATPGTSTKVTYSAKGLVTSGASLALGDLPTGYNIAAGGISGGATNLTQLDNRVITNTGVFGLIITNIGAGGVGLKTWYSVTTNGFMSLHGLNGQLDMNASTADPNGNSPATLFHSYNAGGGVDNGLSFVGGSAGGSSVTPVFFKGTGANGDGNTIMFRAEQNIRFETLAGGGAYQLGPGNFWIDKPGAGKQGIYYDADDGGLFGINCPSPSHYLDIGGDIGDSQDGSWSIDAGGNFVTQGKISADGGIDPPYMLLDAHTRAEIKGEVLVEVPTNKQTGAAVYFNPATHKLEMYVASEDKFYDVNGNLLSTNVVAKAFTPFKPVRHVRGSTNTVNTVTNR